MNPLENRILYNSSLSPYKNNRKIFSLFLLVFSLRVLAFAESSPSQQTTPTALIILKQEIQAFPNSSPLRRNLGEFYLKLKKYRKAEQAFQTAISLNPQDLRARYDLGTTYEKSDDYLDAQQAYFKTFICSKQLLCYKMGICYLRLKRYGSAVSILNQAAKVKNTAKIKYALAAALAGQGNYSEALKDLRSARGEDPDFREGKKIFGSQGFLLKQENKWKEKWREKFYLWFGAFFSIFWISLFIYFKQKVFFFRRFEEEEEY